MSTDQQQLLAEYRQITDAQLQAAEERSRIINQLYDTGMTWAEVGVAVGLSRQRCQKMAERTRTTK